MNTFRTETQFQKDQNDWKGSVGAAQRNGKCLRDTDAEYAIARCQFILLSDTALEISSLKSSNRWAHLHESYRTLRDGSFWGGVVPGTSCQATIMLSLRDEIDSAPRL